MNRKFIKNLIIDILIAAAIAGCISLVLKPTIVRGESMDDTFHDGNYLIVYKLAYKTGRLPEHGDIVVLESDLEDEKLLIKRVIGIAGDKVSVRNADVYVNGKKLEEPYVYPGTQGSGENETWKVPANSVFVMGDNRDVSLDSRSPEVGYVDREDLVGKVVLRLYPFDQIGRF